MLAHSVVTASTEPEQYMLFMHGILGSRSNWRGIARRFVEARPAWGAILIDLREHGDSLGFERPHTLEAAASDVGELTNGLGLPVGGALGHSFGGKVVLEWVRFRAGSPTEAWIIDSSPSARDDAESNATVEVLEILKALPSRWPSRESFVSAVVGAGQPEPIAQWLAMNLRRTNDGARRLGPDLGAIEDLIADYGRTDLWDVVESPPEGCTLDVVIGERSAAFSPEDRRRITEIANRSAQVSAHVVRDAGHWVHVDSADALVALLASR